MWNVIKYGARFELQFEQWRELAGIWRKRQSAREKTECIRACGSKYDPNGTLTHFADAQIHWKKERKTFFARIQIDCNNVFAQFIMPSYHLFQRASTWCCSLCSTRFDSTHWLDSNCRSQSMNWRKSKSYDCKSCERLYLHDIVRCSSNIYANNNNHKATECHFSHFYWVTYVTY